MKIIFFQCQIGNTSFDRYLELCQTPEYGVNKKKVFEENSAISTLAWNSTVAFILLLAKLPKCTTVDNAGFQVSNSMMTGFKLIAFEVMNRTISLIDEGG